MKGIGGAVIALAVMTVLMIPLTLIVCVSAVATKSVVVAFVGFAAGIPFVFYAGYRIARRVVKYD